MKFMPFQHVRKSPPGKASLHNPCLHVDRDFVLPVFRMKMWRSVIIIEYSYHDPQES